MQRLAKPSPREGVRGFDSRPFRYERRRLHTLDLASTERA
jgi:hypothetical protein